MTTNYLTNYLKDNRTLAQLKAIAKERGIVPTGDKRLKATWVDALATPAPTPTSATKKSQLEIAFGSNGKALNLSQLKELAKQKGVQPTDKRNKQSYITALKLALAA